MRKFLILTAAVGAIIVGGGTLGARAQTPDLSKWLVVQPDNTAAPVGLTLKAMTVVTGGPAGVKVLGGTPIALVENTGDSDIVGMTCNGYAITGPGADDSYHNPETIPAHTMALVNFDYASKACSKNPIVITFEDGKQGQATGNSVDIFKSTRVVVSKR